MKKVLFVIHSLGYGGAERSLVNLLNELPRENYEVDLLLFQKQGDFLHQLPEWIRILDTPAPLRGLYSPLRQAGKYAMTKLAGTACATVARSTRKSRAAYRWRHFYRRKIGAIPTYYDVAAAYVGTEVMYFVRDCVSAGRKLVWIHNDYRTAGYSQEDDRPCFGDMDAIVSVSDGCVKVLQEVFPEYRERMHYVENITSSAVVRKQALMFAPEEYQESSCNILSIGRLSSQKGFDMAVEAAAILKKSGLSFCWFIIGEGALREALEKKIKEATLEDCVRLLGTRHNPYPYIKNASVLVQSSRFEGKSVVLDETKILCTPIIATDYPTVRDQILDGKEGLIVPMSPQGIADGILALLQDEALRLEICDYLTEHEYGNQTEVKKYIQLLDE